MPLLNYTTGIDADKTAGEIANMLRKAGARAVLTEYDENGEYVSSLSFKMRVGEQEMGFKLPCDWVPVLAVLERDHAAKKNRAHKGRPDREQAVRVAWRIVKDWVEAQLAIIETRMVSTETVFLPYAIMRDGRTLGETVQSDPRFLLGSGHANGV